MTDSEMVRRSLTASLAGRFLSQQVLQITCFLSQTPATTTLASKTVGLACLSVARQHRLNVYFGLVRCLISRYKFGPRTFADDRKEPVLHVSPQQRQILG